jgi:hypothetical protein
MPKAPANLEEAASRSETPAWYTPPQVARARNLRVSKVLAWIARGELEAVNCAERQGGRPRWRISAAALAEFDRARSSRASIVPSAPRRRAQDPEVTRFF